MRCLRFRRRGDVLFIGKMILCLARDDIPHGGTGGRDRTGKGLLARGIVSIDTEAETIESYLHETEEFHNDWGEQYRGAYPPPC